MGSQRKVLVLGAAGMLGHAVLSSLARSPSEEVTGTARSPASRARLPEPLQRLVLDGIDVETPRGLDTAFEKARPDVVINCVGLVKQLAHAEDPIAAISVNALLPHQLLRRCEATGARLVHISTDCVFSGTRGMYREDDAPDAEDLYGRSKLLGEVGGPRAVTLRTSIVGPELGTAHGLLGWFLSQRGPVKGYRRAIFSGLSTVELARVIRDHVIPRDDIRGLHHVSAAPISKLDLLRLFARAYGKSIEIVPDDTPVIDRSLDSTRFRTLTGYAPPAWPELVQVMRQSDPTPPSTS
jgi:dTDP-4-dehydrorhamnose reductase